MIDTNFNTQKEVKDEYITYWKLILNMLRHFVIWFLLVLAFHDLIIYFSF